MTDRYNVSKLLEVFACREIAREHPVKQLKVSLNFVSDSKVTGIQEVVLTVSQVNPGWCHSELVREIRNPVISVIMKICCRTTEVGSRTLVHAGLAGPETHGQYISDCKVTACAPLVEGKEGPKIQRRVWQELSEKLNDIEPGVTKVLDA